MSYLRQLWICALTIAALAAPAFADDLPATRLTTAPLVTPSSAWTYYGASTVHTDGAGAWREGGQVVNPPEIRAQARSLGADRLALGEITAAQYTQNVFDYVRNNIDVEFRFGLGKGARAALIDQSGTPFDQAELMVKLLREGGVTANLQIGTITLNATEFGLWSGLITNLNEGAQTFTVSAQAACQFLADGGIPATVNTQSTCAGLTGNLSTVTLAHVWVQANGNLYDPSYKRHNFRAGIDLASAMGCGTAAAPACGSTITAAALAGATQGTIGPANAPTIQDANEAAVTAQLNTYAQALQANLEANRPTARVEDIIGGQVRDHTYAPTPSSNLPYTSSVQATWTGGIPDQFRTTLNVQFDPFSQTLYADEVAGRRLRVIRGATSANPFSGDPVCPCNVYFFADDVVLGTPNPSAGNPTTVTLTANHPYAALSGSYSDQTVTLYVAHTPFTIVQEWGVSTSPTLTHISQLAAIDPSPFRGGSSLDPGYCSAANLSRVSCHWDEQPALSTSFLVQRATANRIVGDLSQASITSHHSLGAIWSAPSLNFHTITAVGLVSINSRQNNAGDRASAFEISTTFASILEGSLGRQVVPGAEPFSAVANLVVDNRNHVRLVNVGPAAMSSTLPALSGYSGGTHATNLQSAANAGFTFILPEQARGFAWGSLSGTGELGYQADQLAYLIDERIKGGGGVTVPDPVGRILSTIDAAQDSTRGRNTAQVDLADGNLTIVPQPDIVTGAGDFPYSLALQRTYVGGARANEYPGYYTTGPVPENRRYSGVDQDDYSHLGGGWVHNFQLTASFSNDAMVQLGRDDALDATSIITGMYALRTMGGSPTFQQRVTSLLINYWMGSALDNNVVSVHVGAQTELFSRLPNGRFNPRPGSSSQLTQTGSRVAVDNLVVVGGAIQWDYSPVTLRLSRQDGSTIDFSVASTHNPYRIVNNQQVIWPIGDNVFRGTLWSFPDGMRVTLAYSTYAANYQPNVGPNWTRYYLTSVTNNLGRSLTFTTVNTGVSDPSFGILTDVGRRISAVTDESGRVVSFAHTGCFTLYRNNGGGTAGGYSFATSTLACSAFTSTLEATSTTPARTTRYEYEGVGYPTLPSAITRSPYRIVRTYTPSDNATPYLTFGYDAFFRVASIADTLGHTERFYPGGLNGEVWRPGVQVNALGQANAVWFDYRSRPIRTVDPLLRTNTVVYDDLARTRRSTRPEGDWSLETFDPRGNTLSVSRHPKPGSPLADIVTSSTYGEPGVLSCSNLATCNLPATTTDGRGGVTNYTWNSAGQLTQILGPADMHGLRPQTEFTYTSTTIGGFAVSLLTTRTDRISAAQYRVTEYAYDSSNKFALRSSTVDPSGLNLRTCYTFDAVGNLTSVTDPRGTVGGCP